MDVNRIKRIIETYRIWLILLAIFFVAFSIRYLTKGELLFDPDSYWWYRVAMYFAGIKTEYFIEQNGKLIDQLAYYPTGRVINWELLGLPLAIGHSFKILSSFGIEQSPENMMKWMFIIGPVFGGLKSVMAFLLVKELANTRIAAFSTLLYTVSTSSMTRNTAGDTGQESLGGVFIFLWLYLFIKAIKEPAFSKKQVVFSIGGGIFIVFAKVTWGGNVFYSSLVAVSIFIYLVYNIIRNENVSSYERLFLPYVIFIISEKMLSFLLLPLRYPLISLDETYVIPYFNVLLCASLLLAKNKLKPFHTFFILIGISFFLLLASGKLNLIESFVSFVKNLYAGEKGGQTGPTVAYYRSSTMEDFRNMFGSFMIFLPFSIAYVFYDFYKKKGFNNIFLIAWLFLGALAFRWMIRLSFYLSLVIPIVTLILIDAFLIYTKKKNEEVEVLSKSSKKALREQAQSIKTYVKFYNLAAYSLIFILVISNLNSGITYASGSKVSDRSVVPWKDVGSWIRENTPKDALLIHWWDYGYHLQTFAERRTIVDGGNSGPQVTGGSPNRNVDVATIFTSEEDKADEIIKLYNPENRPVYFLVSYEEFGKSGAINFHVNDELYIFSATAPRSGNIEQDNRIIQDFITGNQITAYYIVNMGDSYLIWYLYQFDGNGEYHPEWSEKLLVKLLPFNIGYAQGLKHFQLVYQNGLVYVYKYIP